MEKVFVFDHPIIHHHLAIIRDKRTQTELFSQSVDKIANLMAYEITKNLATEKRVIETPLTDTEVNIVSQDTIIVPILRAGLGMVEGFKAMIPHVKVGHIGLVRNEETLQPEQYFCKLPAGIDKAKVILVDPMLATGGSAAKALEILKAYGANDIILASIVGAPEGVSVITQTHPDVPIYLAALDTHLNNAGYIVPGLGDAGDRIFGTN